MRLSEVLLVYVCVGLAVAAGTRGARRWLAIPLWPLVLPSLLVPPTERFDTVPRPLPSPPGEVDLALQRVRDALQLWDAAPALPLDALRHGLTDLDDRRAALAALLDRPEYRDDPRRANVVALRELHDRLRADLSAALGRMDDLVTRIQLAHFGGAPLDDLAAQLAALLSAVEGVRSAHAEVDGHDTRA